MLYLEVCWERYEYKEREKKTVLSRGKISIKKMSIVQPSSIIIQRDYYVYIKVNVRFSSVPNDRGTRPEQIDYFVCAEIDAGKVFQICERNSYEIVESCLQLCGMLCATEREVENCVWFELRGFYWLKLFCLCCRKSTFEYRTDSQWANEPTMRRRGNEPMWCSIWIQLTNLTISSHHITVSKLMRVIKI